MINSVDFIDTVIGFIILEISNQEFCVNIKDVYTIVNPNDMDQPGLYSPSFPHITVDKSKVPILSLHKHFGLALEELTEHTRIIIVEANGRQFGFFVDHVKEVFTMSKGLREKIDYIPYEGMLRIKATLLYKNRIFYMPDFQSLAEEYFEKKQ